MSDKCNSLLGRFFGHKIKEVHKRKYVDPEFRCDVVDVVKTKQDICIRCGQRFSDEVEYYREGFNSWTAPSYIHENVRKKGFHVLEQWNQRQGDSRDE